MRLLDPLPETKNLSQMVFERIREAIVTGELPPGSRLVERRLAEELEVSHIPVREALARLARRRPRRAQCAPRLMGCRAHTRRSGGDLEPAGTARAIRRRAGPGAVERRRRAPAARARDGNAERRGPRRRRPRAPRGHAVPRGALGACGAQDAARAGGQAPRAHQQLPSRGDDSRSRSTSSRPTPRATRNCSTRSPPASLDARAEPWRCTSRRPRNGSTRRSSSQRAP